MSTACGRSISTTRSSVAKMLKAAKRDKEEDEDDGGGSGDRSYRYLVRRSYLASILAAWLVTVPASGLLAALLVVILRPLI